ncbi:MAG: 50S ribosomal protein L11 methyltransferase [Clostridia bacterium]|nr:50S ribosomal protein L11 methyltransferase [Clostridia bacterium]
MEWTQLKAVCAASDLDEVCAVMSMLDNGLMIEDYSDIEEGLNTCYGDLIDESILEADKTVAAVSIFVPEEKNCADYVAFLRERFTAAALDVKLSLAGIDEEDWANEWKKYYKPIKTGNRIVIVPMWQDYDAAEGELIVKMDPGMAFGTGTHETTRLCASMLETYLKPGDRMLDVGTGSGILAVCASKLGASHVNAYDIDPVAVRVAIENAEANACNNITCEVSDLLASVSLENGVYDIACANIVAEIIIRMAPDISRYLKKGALLVTSGIIDKYANDVITAMEEAGLSLHDRISENGWHAIVFKA